MPRPTLNVSKYQQNKSMDIRFSHHKRNKSLHEIKL